MIAHIRAEIRAASPEDSRWLARLMYMAGRGHVERSVYDLLIPGPYGLTAERISKISELLTAQTLSWFHHSFYTVAEVEGKVAACLCALEKRKGRGRVLVEAMRETGWSDEDLAAMGERMQPYFRVEPSIPDRTWVIENVASFPEYRRNGLVNRLLLEAVERGRGISASRMQIGCFIGNVPAIRAYEKVGFRVVEEKTDPEFERIFGCPGMARLVLEP